MMRIITGSARGVRLETLPGDDVTRPTAERVKEAVFSAIQFDIEGREVLDLFGGSGQMGLEALSRGAAHAMFVDATQEAIAVIRRNAERARLSDRCRTLISDYRSYIRKARGRDRYDLIFLDPPYAMHALPDALARLLRAGLCKPGCILVCEGEDEDVFAGDDALGACFETRKVARYSRTWIHILICKEVAADESDAVREL